MTRRSERIGEQLRAELARLLLEETADPRLRFVTLTRVDVSPDLERADVLFSSFAKSGREDVAAVEAGLESAAGFLRHRLARALSLRKTPQLHFHHDPSLALGADTLTLLRSLRDDEPSP